MLRPWLEGLCDYQDLKDGTLDLADIAMMNDALDVRDENAYRVQKASEK